MNTDPVLDCSPHQPTDFTLTDWITGRFYEHLFSEVLDVLILFTILLNDCDDSQTKSIL